MKIKKITTTIILFLSLFSTINIKAENIQGYYFGYNLKDEKFTLLELFESNNISERKSIKLLETTNKNDTYELKIIDKINNITKKYLIFKNKEENENIIKICKINKDNTLSTITTWEKLTPIELD